MTFLFFIFQVNIAHLLEFSSSKNNYYHFNIDIYMQKKIMKHTSKKIKK